jgi:hypothetical protein
MEARMTARTLLGMPLIVCAFACSGKSTGGGATGGASGVTGGMSGGASGASATGTTGAAGASGASGDAGANGTAGSTGASGTAGAGAGGAGAAKRPWPDSTAKTLVLADELPSGLTPAQQQFVVTHMVGSQKLTLADSQPLRALAPNFLVLHYHLAIWQSAPGVPFIVDGRTWGNDYPMVTTHEDWFWHNAGGARVAAIDDGKLVMNLGSQDFIDYWKQSFIAQAKASDADGVFADSASPDLLEWEAQKPPEPRFANTGVRDTAIPELGGRTYIMAWQDFMKQMDAALAAEGLALLPNTGSFTTSWDTTDYSLTAGVFVEGFADTSMAPADWQRSTNEILGLVAKDKIVIVQNYLKTPDDVATRVYYLANYLLVRGARTYLDYFAKGPLEWYPEWALDLGAPVATATTVADLSMGGAYEREFANGWAVVNPGATSVIVMFPAGSKQLLPQGGGAIEAGGATPGTTTTMPVTSLTLTPQTAAIVLK